MKKELKKLNIRLTFDHIITTLNVKKVSNSGIILTSKEQGEILTRQTVLACGPNSMVTVGEEVEININLFKRKFTAPKNGIGKDLEEIIPPVELIDGAPYLFITSREIKYIYIDPTSVSTEQPAYAELLRGKESTSTKDKPC
jgi:hypothetical protein